MKSRIVGTGRAVPEKVLTNADLEKMVDTSDEWISTRTGIRERHVLEPKLACSDLATEACRKACQAAGVAPSEVDCVIVGTVTGDMPFPSTACVVQKKLGVPAGVPAFDLQAACAGFLYAMTVGSSFIESGRHKRVLVVGSEVLTRIVDWTDRNTCVLFGDAAGAVLLAPESDPRKGILSTHIYADGNLSDLLYLPAGGSAEPASAETVAAKRHYVTMNGREVYRHAVKNMSASCKAAMETNNLKNDDITTVFAHQANLRIIEGVAQRLELPLDRFFINIHRYGNTSSASIPISLDEAVEQGRLKQGDTIILSALGGGLAWGSAAVVW